MNPEEQLAANSLEYERYNLNNCIVKVGALLDKCPPESKQLEYYTTMHDTMIALQHAAGSWDSYARQYRKLLLRIEMLELQMRIPK